MPWRPRYIKEGERNRVQSERVMSIWKVWTQTCTQSRMPHKKIQDPDGMLNIQVGCVNSHKYIFITYIYLAILLWKVSHLPHSHHNGTLYDLEKVSNTCTCL